MANVNSFAAIENWKHESVLSVRYYKKS